MTRTAVPGAGSSLADRPTSGRAEVATLGPLVLLLAGMLHLASRAGTGVAPVLLAVAAVSITQVLPGVVVWRWVRPRDGWLVEDLVLGFACGAALAVVGQVAAVATGAGWSSWALPPGVAVVLLVLPGPRRRVLTARWAPVPRWWGALVGLAAVPALTDAWRTFGEPLSWQGAARWYVDLPYHLALAGELSHRWPPHYPQVAGEPLSYHWFSHAWMAQVGATSGVELDVVLMRVMPTLMGLAVPVAIAVLAVRVTRSAAAGPIAGGVAAWVGWLDLWGGSVQRPFLVYSPSLAFSVLLLAALAALLVLRWRGEAARGGSAVLLILAVVAGGAKGTVLPVAVVGVVAVAIALAIHRDRRWRVALADAAVLLVSFVVLGRLVFGAAVGVLELRPLDALAGEWQRMALGPSADPSLGTTAVLTVLLVLGLLLPLLAGLAVLADAEARRDPAPWFFLGVAVAGNGALLLLDHPSGSQLYFPRTAAALAAVLVAWGLVRVVRRPGPVVVAAVAAGVGVLLRAALPDRPSLALGAAALGLLVLPVLAAAGALALRAHAWRPGVAAAVVGLTVLGVPAAVARVESIPARTETTATGAYAVTSGQRVAARWIRAHSDPDDVVMTNRHCVRPRMRTCQSRRFWVAAYSERGVLVEGWSYTARANATGVGTDDYDPLRTDFWDPDLLTLNDRFYRDPTAAAAERLRELGVGWVFVDRTVQHRVDLAPYAARRLRNPTAEVWELTE